MIDIHCHILPLVDDGCSSIEESRKLLINAINEGISDVCITPHFSRNDDYVCRADALNTKFNELKNACSDLKINLFLGNELMIDKDLDELLINKQLLSLNESKYVLVEFPFEGYKSEYDEYLYNISISGYKIIIAHPERYMWVINNPKYIDKWLNEGYYIQCNVTSLNDRKIRNFMYKLIEEGKMHFICSDAHNVNRPLSLVDGYKLISKKFNDNVADVLFNDNPKKVLFNDNVQNVDRCKRRLF